MIEWFVKLLFRATDIDTVLLDLCKIKFAKAFGKLIFVKYFLQMGKMIRKHYIPYIIFSQF